LQTIYNIALPNMFHILQLATVVT